MISNPPLQGAEQRNRVGHPRIVGTERTLVVEHAPLEELESLPEVSGDVLEPAKSDQVVPDPSVVGAEVFLVQTS